MLFNEPWIVMSINWLYIGLIAFFIYAGIFGYFVSKRRWTRAALGVGLANMLIVLLNLVAPFRGIFDPAYLGYNVGMLSIEPGIGVTLVAGAVVLGALTAACLAVINVPGRSMRFIAIVDTVFLLLIGIPVMISGLTNPSAYQIQLGEFLFIPGLVAVFISIALFTIPLLASVIWSYRRISKEGEARLTNKSHAFD